MTALGCILFGIEGHFSLPGNINFSYTGDVLPSLHHVSFFSSPLAWSLRFKPLQTIALGYLHVTIHELGHALVAKVRGASSVSINIDTSGCSGSSSSGMSHSLIQNLAGPMAGMLFRIGLIALTTLLVGTIPAYILTTTKILSLTWMTGEMIYFITGSRAVYGDWGDIVSEGPLPWAIGATAITASYIAGIALAL